MLLCNFKKGIHSHRETHVCVFIIFLFQYNRWVKIHFLSAAPCVSVPLSALWWLSLEITEYDCQFKIDLYASWCNGIMKPKLDLLDLFFNLSVWRLSCIIHYSYSIAWLRLINSYMPQSECFK